MYEKCTSPSMSKSKNRLSISNCMVVVVPKVFFGHLKIKKRNIQFIFAMEVLYTYLFSVKQCDSKGF